MYPLKIQECHHEITQQSTQVSTVGPPGCIKVTLFHLKIQETHDEISSEHTMQPTPVTYNFNVQSQPENKHLFLEPPYKEGEGASSSNESSHFNDESDVICHPTPQDAAIGPELKDETKVWAKDAFALMLLIFKALLMPMYLLFTGRTSQSFRISKKNVQALAWICDSISACT